MLALLGDEPGRGAAAAERSLTSELNVEIDAELVLHAHGSACDLDGLDAELCLAKPCAADVVPFSYAHFDGDGLRLAMQCEVPTHGPAITRLLDGSGFEEDFAMPLGVEHVGAEHRLLDVRAVLFRRFGIAHAKRGGVDTQLDMPTGSVDGAAGDRRGDFVVMPEDTKRAPFVGMHRHGRLFLVNQPGLVGPGGRETSERNTC